MSTSDRSSKYRATPSCPAKDLPRKGASCGRPCSWTRGVGCVVKVERRVDIGLAVGAVRAAVRARAGSRRVLRGVILDFFLLFIWWF